MAVPRRTPPSYRREPTARSAPRLQIPAPCCWTSMATSLRRARPHRGFEHSTFFESPQKLRVCRQYATGTSRGQDRRRCRHSHPRWANASVNKCTRLRYKQHISKEPEDLCHLAEMNHSKWCYSGIARIFTVSRANCGSYGRSCCARPTARSRIKHLSNAVPPRFRVSIGRFYRRCCAASLRHVHSLSKCCPNKTHAIFYAASSPHFASFCRAAKHNSVSNV